MDETHDGLVELVDPAQRATEATMGMVRDLMGGITGAMAAVLSEDPSLPVCVAVVARDGVAAAVHATTTIGYAQAPRPDKNDPEWPLYESIGSALKQPRQPGAEYIVVVHHQSEERPDGQVLTTVHLLLAATRVRAVVAELLPVPRTPDERACACACAAIDIKDAGPGIDECVKHADQSVRAFEEAIDDMEAQVKVGGPRPNAAGREMIRWLRAPGSRALQSMRHRLLITMMLRLGNIDAARWLKRSGDVARDVVLPSPTTARNTEVLAMSAAILFSTFYNGLETADAYEYGGLAIHLMDVAYPRFMAAGLFGRARGGGAHETLPVWMHKFLNEWRASAFARLEVSHKLAAALVLTDVPESEELHAPWEAWSLIVPDGLLGDQHVVARVWCVGTEPKFIVTKSGLVETWTEQSAGGPVAAEMLRSLVRSACIVLSDPERMRAEGKWGSGAATVPKHKRPAGPPAEGARYVLAQPVTIDLRETVIEALTGRRKGGGSPKVQFLVRGHPREQAWGPRHTLRRKVWIEPFWKGDPDARVLLRSHRVQDDDSGPGGPT